MFDFVTRRRLIFSLAAVFFVTVSLLFIAHIRTNFMYHVLPSYTSMIGVNTSNDEQISTCHQFEQTEVIRPCQKCSSYEYQYQVKTCSPTGYKEVVLCTKSNIKTSRSCSIPIDVQRKHFWAFEGLMLLVAFVAVVSVQFRQKQLDKQMVEKIKRQIGENEE